MVLKPVNKESVQILHRGLIFYKKEIWKIPTLFKGYLILVRYDFLVWFSLLLVLFYFSSSLVFACSVVRFVLFFFAYIFSHGQNLV